MGILSGPPYGIPISPEVHEQYSPEVKEAWIIFDGWFKEQLETDDQISRGDMPEEVRQSMQIILDTPIPTMEGTTGEDSCYMVNVQRQMIN